MQRHFFGRVITSLAFAGILLAAIGVSAVYGGPAASAASSGGSLTVALVGSEFLSLDPTLDPNAGSDQTYFDALYGGLFYQTPSEGIGMGLASGYSFSKDDKTLTITLRPGLKFTDGTPLNAAAVAYNFKRDRNPATENAGNVASFIYVTSVTTSGDLKVQLHTSIPDPAMIQGFIPSGMNFPASPTAIQKEGSTGFGQKPVGAGPYEVQSFDPSNKIVMAPNPTYWDAGHPKLQALTFLNVASDQSGYAALETGTAQMLVSVTTPSIITQAKSAYNVNVLNGPIVTDLEFNTYKAPFNNLKARQAVTYALNPTQQLATNSPGLGQVVKGIEGPGNPYYETQAPGYLGYNPTKAKALVQQLGGLSMTIISGTSPADTVELDALQNELSQANISVKLQPEPLSTSDADQKSGNWEAITGGSGGADPDVGEAGLVERFLTGSPYSCCKDTTLDTMIQKTLGAPTKDARKAAVSAAAAYIMKHDYIVPLYAIPEVVIANKSVTGATFAAAQDAWNITVNWPDLQVK